MSIKNNQVNEIPKKNLSKAGYFFLEEDHYWQLDKNTNVDVGGTSVLLDDDLVFGYRKTLIYYAENLSGPHVFNINARVKHMLKTVKSSSITVESLINYRSTLSQKHEWYLSVIRGFLRKWCKLGLFGISDNVVDLLMGWQFKGNEKGDVVKRLDPLQGPLSDLELQGFNECAIQSFEKKEISLFELALGLCQSNTGRRPIQISHLKVKDVLQGKNKKGDPTFLLNVPRAKQRGASFRDEFKQFAVTLDLWTILKAQAKQVVLEVQKVCKFELEVGDQLELPLFPCMTTFQKVTSLKELRSICNSDRLHIKANIVTEVVQKIAFVSHLHSERTGEPIELTAKRFRYTIGTRAAREGFGEMIIAELLDHSDTQNAGVYIQNIPDHVEKLDQAVGQYLAPYAQAFAGVLVDSEKKAVRGDDINSRIRVTGSEGIGTCGNHGFCGASAPIPCYTCIHFQPWVDGPHDLVYEQLISERERIKEITGDIQIAAINDRTIIAVADVIDRCKKRKEEMNNGKDISFHTQKRIEGHSKSQYLH